jgi:hypothetical protein
MIKHLVGYEITGGIQNPRWDTRSPVGYKTSGGIQNARWDTKRPVGYKTSGGIQNVRWDTKRPVGYKNPGGIWGSSKKSLIVYKNPAGSVVPLKNRCRTKTPAGSVDHIG